MWLKYSHKFADGPSEPEWKFLSIQPAHAVDLLWVEDLVLDLGAEFDWSEHYRGIDYEVVDTIPSDVLEKEIAKCESNMEYYSKHLEYLKTLVKNE
jgi:hypothetical protein